jgi:hypothetical protein
VIVFVSYARKDTNLQALRQIANQITVLGRPYIDDLHNQANADRLVTVTRALHAATSFVAILSSNYLRTEWTRKEFEIAMRRRIPMVGLTQEDMLMGELPEWITASRRAG